MMAKKDQKEISGWFDENKTRFESLCELVASIVESLLQAENIEYLSVTHRCKTKDSFLEKESSRKYSNPREQITDIAGIRVITYIDSDAHHVAELIQTAFKVHAEDSLDKSDELGIDRVGYRSVHVVCDIGEKRCQLPECTKFKGLAFEIQVRTVLQHAWAEIEHDRDYKFGNVLPSPLRRRMKLVAGILELADREFDSIAKDIDKYEKDIQAEARQGDLDLEINSSTLKLILPEIRSCLPDGFDFAESLSGDSSMKIILELNRFGAMTIQDVKDMLTSDFFSFEFEEKESTTMLGLLRGAMMYHDIRKYFDLAWNTNWTYIDRQTHKKMVDRYDKKTVDGIFKKIHMKFEEQLH